MGRSALLPGQRAKLRAAGVTDEMFAALAGEHRGRIFNRAPAKVGAKNITLPKNSDELAEMLDNEKTRNEVFRDKESTLNFIQGYAAAQQGPDSELFRQVKAASQAAMIDFLRSVEDPNIKRVALHDSIDPQRGDTPRMVRNARAYAVGHNPRAAGAVLDAEFADSGDYFRSLGPSATVEDAQRWGRLRNAYSTIVPSEGGFLVPEALRSQLLQVALESAVVRSRAFVVPMETQKLSFPMVDSTTNVGSVFGGMVAYWTEEGAALTQSSATFGRVSLEAKKLTGYAEVPSELIADSLPSFSAFVDQAWPQALAFFEDLAFIRGTGVGEPLGFLGAGNNAAIAVAKESGQAADTLQWLNVINMYSRMLPGSLSRAVWLVAPNVFPQLATMSLTVGTGGAAVWMPDGHGAPVMTLLGRPVIMSEKMNVLGDRGDIALVDLGYYLIGDRQEMTARASEDYKFGNDKVAYRIIERVDGRPWIQSAITPANGGPTLSPFVELADRA